MPFIPVPNTALVALRMTLDSQQIENTLGFVGDAPWTPTDLFNLCGQVREWWLDNVRSLVNTAVTLREIYGISLEDESAPSVVNVSGLPSAGTHTGEVLPNNVTCTVTFRTALRGRSYRGRNYVVGLADTQLSAPNTVASVTTSAYVSAYLLLNTGVTVNSAVHCVISRQHDNEPRTTGVATPVTSYAMNSTLDSMRRRLPGRGS